MKTFRKISFAFLLIVLLLTACNPAQKAVPTASITSTPDYCAPGNIEPQVARVHSLMRRFDDAASLAASTKVSQIGPVVAGLQSIRRAAEDQGVPPCLVTLKKLQLAHMNTVIQTMLAFMGGADQKTLNQGIAFSRQQHDAYTIELARLLGLTVVAPPTVTAGAPAPQTTASPTHAVIIITNPGPNPLNMHASPALSSQTVGTLGVGQSTAALGKSDTGEWILIDNPAQPGQTVWVNSSLVKFSGSDPAALAVVTPTP
jgi:hypothetical protein